MVPNEIKQRENRRIKLPGCTFVLLCVKIVDKAFRMLKAKVDHRLYTEPEKAPMTLSRNLFARFIVWCDRIFSGVFQKCKKKNAFFRSQIFFEVIIYRGGECNLLLYEV